MYLQRGSVFLLMVPCRPHLGPTEDLVGRKSMLVWLCGSVGKFLHVGNYSWQLLSKAPGIVNTCDCVGRSRLALCASLDHSCGDGETAAAIDLSLLTSPKE